MASSMENYTNARISTSPCTKNHKIPLKELSQHDKCYSAIDDTISNMQEKTWFLALCAKSQYVP